MSHMINRVLLLSAILTFWLEMPRTVQACPS